MDFGIDYDDDVDLALALLIETAKADSRIVVSPPPWAKLTALGDSTVTVTLRAWTSPQGFRDTRFDLIKDVKANFEYEGLTFAYPHQVAVDARAWTVPDRERQRLALKARQGEVTQNEESQTHQSLQGDPTKGSTSEAD